MYRTADVSQPSSNLRTLEALEEGGATRGIIDSNIKHKMNLELASDDRLLSIHTQEV